MKSISYTALRKQLSTVMDDIEKDRIEYQITRKNHPNIIMITEEDYNSLQETLHLLSSSTNASRLHESIKQAKLSQFIEVDLDD